MPLFSLTTRVFRWLHTSKIVRYIFILYLVGLLAISAIPRLSQDFVYRFNYFIHYNGFINDLNLEMKQ